MATSDSNLTMFRPPAARGMGTLDRSFFQTKVPLKAARVVDNKLISSIRQKLVQSNDLLRDLRCHIIRPDPDLDRAKLGLRCFLLRPELQATGTSAPAHQTDGQRGNIVWPHSSVVADLVERRMISIIPYTLNLDYAFWTYQDIVSAIIPAGSQDELPSGFTSVGHIAHFNLREQWQPYKHLIAQILLDKNSNLQTVINKIDDVGEESEFRTFRYEVLAGPDDLNVVVSNANCTFAFDYSKVYWNPRLHTEHHRLVSTFQEGEAVCDVMAGIGPFAVPAGKQKVFVWANDLNPDSYSSLQDAIRRNKVGAFVTPFNVDGRHFIRDATSQLLHSCPKFVEVPEKSRKHAAEERSIKTYTQPKTFQHYVMNLPGSALTFLPSFIGLYAQTGCLNLLPSGSSMPLIHVYCFGRKILPGDDSGSTYNQICEEISRQLGFEMKCGECDDGNVSVFEVRDVAPKKSMFCASFRLPKEVAFRQGLDGGDF